MYVIYIIVDPLLKLSTSVILWLPLQVISGGNYDIDVQLLGPDGEELYNVHKMKYDNFERTATKTGEHKFCFSNTFSSLSQKKVYFDFWVGNEVPLTEDIGAHQTALTQLETSAEKIHESLKVIYNYQVHHRLREAIGRNTGNNLNHRVQYWSMGEAVLFVLVALGQVIILRRFFTEKRTSI